MTTSREKVINRPLSGTELKQLLREDFDRALANYGLLTDYIAYGRVGWILSIKLHLDGAQSPDAGIEQASRRAAKNIIATQPELTALEPAPLADPSPEAVVESTRVTRQVSSPNAERLRVGLPIPVDVRQQDGTRTTELVSYPPDPNADPGAVLVEDSSAETAREWGTIT